MRADSSTTRAALSAGRRRRAETVLLAVMLAGTPSAVVGAASPSGAALDDAPCFARLQPPLVNLHDGRTSALLHVQVRRPDGRPADPSTLTVLWSSADPDVAAVDDTGRVTSFGYGETVVEAQVTDLGCSAEARIVAGSLRLEPPLAVLSTRDVSDVALHVEAATADGTPVPIDDGSVTLECRECGTDRSLELTSDGHLVAHRTTVDPSGIAHVYAQVDGRSTENHTVAIALGRADDLQPELYSAGNIAIATPPNIRGTGAEGMITRWDLPHIIDIGYHFQVELNGRPRDDGARIVFAHVPGYTSDNDYCFGGLNPIWMGIDLNARYIDCLALGGVPQWGVFHHELGHGFLLGPRFINVFRISNRPDDPTIFLFPEGFSSIQSRFVAEMFLERGPRLGVPGATIQSILDHWLSGHDPELPHLTQWLDSGADLESLSPEGLTDMLESFAFEDGWGVIYRLFSIFVPDEESFPFKVMSAEQRMTFLAAAMTAATGSDARPRFEDDWHVTLDSAFYDQILPFLEQAATLRDTAVFAGEDRTGLVGRDVELADAYAVDWEWDPMTYAWTVVDAPPGSSPQLDDAAALRPHFSGDRPGAYLLRLTSTDGLLSGSDEVEITLAEPPVRRPAGRRSVPASPPDGGL